MAYKKTTVKKPVAVQNTQPEVTETVTTQTVNEVPKKVGFEPTDPIQCRSITPGYLAMEGIKTHINYIWSNYNDEASVEYQDLASAVRGSYNQIFDPMIIIENNDFLKEFPQVEKIYAEKYQDSDFDKILALPVDQMVETIENLPDVMKSSLKSVVGDQVRTGQLDSMRKITALESLFKTDFLILRDNQ